MSVHSPHFDTKSKPKIHMISLGCARNRVDAEVMLGTLGLQGWEVTDLPEQAQAIIVNTCGFIGAAKEESIDTILTAAQYKEVNPGLKLVVTGCLPQRYKAQLAKGLPEVDFFVGTDEFPKIAEMLKTPPEKGSVLAKRSHYIYQAEMPRINTLNRFSAYVKIAEGCQHSCAFCIIPAIRGKLRSRPIDNVLREVEHLVKDGVREINLIAQDLAAYGRDLGNIRLLELLRELANIEALDWIRLLYYYPEHIDQTFLDFMASEDKIVKYLDIPTQHASDPVLARMRRNINQVELNDIFTQVRNTIPSIAIRTSVMVGFPGETEDDFKRLKDFVIEQKFAHLGCFIYSQEEGTAAARMPDQIDEETKLRRQSEIMAIQQKISRRIQQGYVGRTLPVLIEGPSSETDLLLQGRLSTQAPEVDGVVLINDGPAKIGLIQQVKIHEALDYDLVGAVVS